MALPWGIGRSYLGCMEFRLQPVCGGCVASGNRVNAGLHTFADPPFGKGDGEGENEVGLGGESGSYGPKPKPPPLGVVVYSLSPIDPLHTPHSTLAELQSLGHFDFRQRVR